MSTMKKTTCICLIIILLSSSFEAPAEPSSHTLAPASQVFGLWLEQAFPPSQRQKFEQKVDRMLTIHAGDGWRQMKELNDNFPQLAATDLGDIKLQLNDNNGVAMVAAVVEFRKQGIENEQASGAALILADTPPFPKREHADYWNLWERSADLRKFERIKLARALQALDIEYETNTNGDIFYLSVDGLAKWNKLHKRLTNIYRQFTHQDPASSGLLDRITQLEKDDDSLTILAVLQDFYRQSLISDRIPLVAIKKGTIQEDGDLYQYSYIEENYATINMFFLQSCNKKERGNDIFTNFLKIPRPLLILQLTNLSDWRKSQSHTLSTESRRLLLRRPSTVTTYLLEHYLYQIIYNEQAPFDRPGRINFPAGFKNLITAMLRDELTTLAKATFDTKDDDTQLSNDPLPETFALLDAYCLQFAAYAIAAMNLAITKNVSQANEVALSLLKENEQLEILLNLINRELTSKNLQAEIKRTQKTLAAFTHEKNTYRKMSSLLQDLAERENPRLTITVEERQSLPLLTQLSKQISIIYQRGMDDLFTDLSAIQDRASNDKQREQCQQFITLAKKLRSRISADYLAGAQNLLVSLKNQPVVLDDFTDTGCLFLAGIAKFIAQHLSPAEQQTMDELLQEVQKLAKTDSEKKTIITLGELFKLDAEELQTAAKSLQAISKRSREKTSLISLQRMLLKHFAGLFRLVGEREHPSIRQGLETLDSYEQEGHMEMLTSTYIISILEEITRLLRKHSPVNQAASDTALNDFTTNLTSLLNKLIKRTDLKQQFDKLEAEVWSLKTVLTTYYTSLIKNSNEILNLLVKKIDGYPYLPPANCLTMLKTGKALSTTNLNQQEVDAFISGYQKQLRRAFTILREGREEHDIPPFGLVFNGDPFILQAFLLFFDSIPPEEKISLLNYLLSLYNQQTNWSRLHKPYTALLISYYYMYKKHRGEETCPDLGSDPVREQDTEALAQTWLRRCFQSLPEAIDARSALAEKDGTIAGYLPSGPATLAQETNRLFHFFLALFTWRENNQLLPVFDFIIGDKNCLDVSYYTHLLKTELARKKRDWKIVISVFMFQMLLREPNLYRLAELEKSIQLLVAAGIPDSYLGVLFNLLNQNAFSTVFIWAKNTLAQLDDSYPQTKELLEIILTDRSSLATRLYLPSLALYYFRKNQLVEALNTSREIIAAINPPTEKTEPISVTAPLQLDCDKEHFPLGNLQEELTQIEGVRALIAQHARAAAQEWDGQAETLAALNFQQLSELVDFTPDKEMPAARREALLRYLVETDFAQLVFMEELIQQRQEKLTELYKIDKPAKQKGSNHFSYYYQQLAAMKEQLNQSKNELTSAFDNLPWRTVPETAKQKADPTKPHDLVVLLYQKFQQEKDQLDYLLKAHEAVNDQDYLTAKHNMEKVTALPEEAPVHLQKQLAYLKQLITSRCTRFEKARKRIEEIIVRLEKQQPFENIAQDIQFINKSSKIYRYLFRQLGSWTKEELVTRLQELDARLDEICNQATAEMEEILNAKIPQLKDWFTLREEIEALHRQEKKHFNDFITKAITLCFNCYENLYPQISKGLFSGNHSIIEEAAFTALNQLAFVGGELLGYCAQTGTINNRHKRLIHAQTISQAAVVMQKIKVQRLVLTLLTEAEDRQNEALKGGHRYCLYKEQPQSISRTRALLSLEAVTTLKDIRNPADRLAEAQRLFYPGKNIIFARDDKLFDDPEAILPTFEIAQVTAEGIELECVNINLFPQADVDDIIKQEIQQQGLLCLQQATALKAQLKLFESIWHDLSNQEDRLAPQKKKITIKPIQVAGPQFNNDPNNLVNALLGLPTVNDPRDLAELIISLSRYQSPNPLPENLSTAQAAFISHICGALTAPNAVDRIVFLQGPGGTGKTYTISNLLPLLVKKNLAVSLTAPTHVAIDTLLKAALEKLSTELPTTGQEVTARFGSVEDKIDPQIKEGPYRNREPLLKRLLPDQSTTESAGNINDSDSFPAVGTQGNVFAHTTSGLGGDNVIRQLRLQLEDPNKLDKAIYRDVVICDEAGMCGLGEILLLAARLAKQNGILILAGDQKQLPPYGIGHTGLKLLRDYFPADSYQDIDFDKTIYRQYVQDIFASSLLEDRHGRYGAHSPFLDENRRSTPLIVNEINPIYKEDGQQMKAIRSPLPVEPKEQIILERTPDSEKEQLLDNQKGQYFNPYEAGKILGQVGIDFDEISDLTGEDIVFISPYKAQIEFFQRLLTLHCLMNELSNVTDGGDFSLFFQGSAAQQQEAINQIAKKINLLAPHFDDNPQELLKDILAQQDADIRADLAAQLAAQLEKKYPQFLHDHWPTAKLTFAQTAHLECQNISEGYTLGADNSGIHSSTVHKIQGQERRIVYISLVRNNDHGNLGFIYSKLGQHMFTTAIGRAKDYLRLWINEKTWQAALKKKPRRQSDYYGQECARLVLRIAKSMENPQPREIPAAEEVVGESV